MTESVERTADGRFIVVDGRRWRATDPAIPESLREELVAELMTARRGVKAASADPAALAVARSRVHDAKVALGERGEAWWAEATPEGRSLRATATARALARSRDDLASVSADEVAQIIASPDWRLALDSARLALSECAALGSDVEVDHAGEVSA